MDGKPGSTLKLTVAYDGSDFWGSQRQATARTVQRELEDGLSRLAGITVTTTFSGRTDRGVHAIGQVVSCRDLHPELNEGRLSRAIEAHLPEDLGLVSVERKAGSFHARFDAVWREYRYRIWSGSTQPLVGRQVWQRRAPLDVEAMALGARQLIGRHDLATFAGGGDGVPWSARAAIDRGTTRTILGCTARPIAPWWGLVPDAGTGVEIRIVADGFLPHLVRNVAGALVVIGSGTQPPTWITDLLAAADRRYGPITAPPNGLILWRVGYGDDVPEPEPDGTRIPGTSDAHKADGLRE
jgi:tRNA pseudouridine38-40 synthase